MGKIEHGRNGRKRVQQIFPFQSCPEALPAITIQKGSSEMEGSYQTLAAKSYQSAVQRDCLKSGPGVL